MSTRGWFDPELVPKGLIDPFLAGSGVIDDELASTVSSTTGDTVVSDIQGVSSFSLGVRRFAAVAGIATALLWSIPRDSSGPLATQPDTYVQVTQGTEAVARGQVSFRKSSLVQSQLSWTLPQDQSAATIPDTYVQEIAGLGEYGQLKQAIQRQVVQGTRYTWTTAQDQSGPLGPQPDTYIPPIEGTSSVRQAQVNFNRSSRAASVLVQFVPQDQPILDPYVQEVVGVAELNQSNRAFTLRSVQSTSYLWTTAQDASGPLAVQPDTYIQPVSGLTGLAARAKAWKAATQVSVFGWTQPEDVSFTPIPDTYVPSIEGLGAVKKAAGVFRNVSVSGAPLLWTLPQDNSGPLGAQPDTYVQPITGLAGVANKARSWKTALAASSLGWGQPEDVSFSTQPETFPLPIEGLQALRKGLASYSARAVSSSVLLWTLPQDNSGPLGAQPDTYVQPVEGVRSLRVIQRSVTYRAVVSVNGWVPASDLPVAQPDTYVQPVSGLTAIKLAQKNWNQHVQASSYGWSIPRDFSVPVTDTWTPVIQGLSSLSRSKLALRSNAMIMLRTGITTAQDVSGPLAVQPDTYVPPVLRSTPAWKLSGRQKGLAYVFVIDIPLPTGPDFIELVGDAYAETKLITSSFSSTEVDNSSFVFTKLTKDPIVPQSYRQVVLNDQPFAYWPLDDVGPTMLDIVGGHNGTISGNVITHQPGLISDGSTSILVTNGSGGVNPAARVEAAGLSALSGTSTISLEAWFQIGPASFDPSNAMTILSFDDPSNSLTGGEPNFGVIWMPASGPVPGHWWVFGEVVVTLSDANVGSVEADTQFTADGPMGPLAGLETGKRVHVVFTFDGTLGILYVNGVRVSSDVPFPTPGAATLLHGDPVWLGAQIWPNDGPAFTGLLGEMVIYPTVLSPERVAAHYAAGFLT